jgi:hypothetical protein
MHCTLIRNISAVRVYVSYILSQWFYKITTILSNEMRQLLNPEFYQPAKIRIFVSLYFSSLLQIFNQTSMYHSPSIMQQLFIHHLTLNTTCFGHRWPSSGVLMHPNCYTALMYAKTARCSPHKKNINN